jgi:outer membrane protein assembly factor BamB
MRHAGVRFRAVAAMTLVCAFLGVGSAPALAARPAVAYQLNPAHTGATTDAIAKPPARLWKRSLDGSVSYPLIADGHVFVTVANSSAYGTKLYALNPRTGQTTWGPVSLGGTYYFSGLAYDAGAVFTVNYDGIMQAFDAATGQLRWTTQLPEQWSFTSPPTAHDGYVYTGGAGDGGTVYAVSESTGDVKWTASVENGDDSSPAVSATGVYVSYACGQTYDFAPLTGALIWYRHTACEGGGGSTPVLAHGRLYVRDFEFPAVLKSSNGKLLGPFEASGPAPAVDADQSYDLVGGTPNAGGTLSATSLSTGFETWTFKGDGNLDSAPIVAGSTVLIGSGSGRLYGLSSATGKLLWSTKTGAPIYGPDEHNAVELTGLASAGGLIVVPASTTLVAYR